MRGIILNTEGQDNVDPLARGPTTRRKPVAPIMVIPAEAGIHLPTIASTPTSILSDALDVGAGVRVTNFGA